MFFFVRKLVNLFGSTSKWKIDVNKTILYGPAFCKGLIKGLFDSDRSFSSNQKNRGYLEFSSVNKEGAETFYKLLTNLGFKFKLYLCKRKRGFIEYSIKTTKFEEIEKFQRKINFNVDYKKQRIEKFIKDNKPNHERKEKFKDVEKEIIQILHNSSPLTLNEISRKVKLHNEVVFNRLKKLSKSNKISVSLGSGSWKSLYSLNPVSENLFWLPKVYLKILLFLLIHHQAMILELVNNLNLSRRNCIYHLRRLLALDFIVILNNKNQPWIYKLNSKGKNYLDCIRKYRSDYLKELQDMSQVSLDSV